MYLASLSNLVIVSHIFVCSLDILYNHITHELKANLFLPIRYLYLEIFISCFTPVTRTSKHLIQMVTVGIFCLVSSIWEKILNILPMYIILVAYFYVPFIRLRKFSSIPSLLGMFIINGYWIFSNVFSIFIEMAFFLSVVNIVNKIDFKG